MKLFKLLLISILLIEPAFANREELVVIGSKDLAPLTLNHTAVVDIFMGRMKRLDDGSYIIPVDIQIDDPLRRMFYKLLMDKKLSEINSYWARLVFSGRGSPPRQSEAVSETIEIIMNNKGAIGYIPADRVTADVHILHRVKKK